MACADLVYNVVCMGTAMACVDLCIEYGLHKVQQHLQQAMACGDLPSVK